MQKTVSEKTVGYDFLFRNRRLTKCQKRMVVFFPVAVIITATNEKGDMHMNIAERIKVLRKSKGLSQEELADRIGVSRQAVSKWESGHNVPDPEKIILLSAALEVTTDYLLLGKTSAVSEIQSETKQIEQIPSAHTLLKKRQFTKKAIAAIVLSVVCIAALTAIGLYRSHTLDVAAIVYAPDGKSACVIYDKNVFQTDNKEPAFCLKEYDGLHGGVWEQLRLRLFPTAGGLCIGGTLESLTWAPDSTGVLLKIQDNSDSHNHYEFVSYTTG